MTLENIWTDDNKLRRVFAWLTRIGASPKFGSRPIGWYQQHQCAAIEYLGKHRFCGSVPLRCRNGAIESKQGTKWISEITAQALYTRADNFCRTGKF